ncbi:MFS transporter [Ferdinandcohnia quinoae]|uniref:MFS transporter n=1 Tax=Fredinandcohnia quinoae TaxID=2918902 RepID=A0AAW5DXY5_9BACI|nr:MFS transporter [Fredinandcohnia sp. SECRCQ15]MCH1624943.1 MFS transporter [Fredinandcohnia sp. SECRCQ15]
MFRIKKVLGDVPIQKDLILLLIIGGLYSLSIALSNTFVNVYLWKQSGEFKDLGFYNLAVVIMQPITFILAGRWAKKIDRVIVLRLGVSFLAIFFITVLLFGDQASKYLLILGGLLGIGYGFYWLAFNVLTFEITEPETRDFFNGFLGLLGSFAGMIGPIVAGYIISSMKSFTGYTVIFGISLALFSGAVILSFFLKRRGAEGNFMFLRILNERKHNENWRYITNAHFVQGIREGTFVFVISVFVFVATGSELALGKFGLLNSAVSFLFYFLATRLIKKRMRKKTILFGGLLLYASIFTILFNITYTKLLIYGVLIGVAYPILLVPYNSLTYDVIGKGWKAGEMRIEYIVVRELFLNAGRVVSILLFLLAITFFDEQKSIPILLAVIGAGHTFIYFFIRKIQIPDAAGPVHSKSGSNRKLIEGEGGSTA